MVAKAYYRLAGILCLVVGAMWLVLGLTGHGPVGFAIAATFFAVAASCFMLARRDTSMRT